MQADIQADRDRPETGILNEESAMIMKRINWSRSFCTDAAYYIR